jgi:predicted MFS family arabinose efflux permease
MTNCSATCNIVPAAVSESSWGAVICLSLLTFVLVASEFMPVSLLTVIAAALDITEGQAGQSITVSGIFAVITSLFGNRLLARFDRRTVVLFYTGILVLAGIFVAFAPNITVFMAGRALIGVAIGGFWSLSTAILSRIVAARDLPKAIAVLQGGAALATVVAPPLGSFLDGLIGWRGAFAVVIPAGIAAMLWQLAVLPRLPRHKAVDLSDMARLLRRPAFAIGTLAVTAAFMGQFTVATYFRPFLEGVTGLEVNTLSAFLLILGLSGLAGTIIASSVLQHRLLPVLIALPATLAGLSLLFLLLGHIAPATALLLAVWGGIAAPIPVAWGTWMTRVIPRDLEAGGGLHVALIQFAITSGAFSGGVLFDTVGWQGPFVLGTGILAVATALATAAVLSTRAQDRLRY